MPYRPRPNLSTSAALCTDVTPTWPWRNTVAGAALLKYTSVTGPGGCDDTAGLLIDEADLEEATPQANSWEAQPFTSSSVPEGERDKQQVVVALKDHHEPVNGVDTAPTGCDTPPDVQPPVSVTESGDECMDVSRDEGSPMAAKRSHERTVNTLVALAQTRGVFSVGAAEGERGHNVSTRGSLTTRTVTRTRLYQHEHRSAGVPENATPCSATDQSTESLHSDRLCAGTEVLTSNDYKQQLQAVPRAQDIATSLQLPAPSGAEPPG
ncbi:hypothetical protein HPB50_028324 [Hyalomma asiaticum]|nr:hypothetical protein HPB50_028324 [Hyalomma asiaticum]